VTTIHLVRHGRTASNARGLLLGHLDPALDADGLAQAVGLAALLEPLAPARVVSSPLQRCRTTAAVIAEAVGVDVELDDRWIELDYGDLDGKPLGDVPRSIWERWRGDLGWAPPGGESLAALGDRVRSACDELAAEARDRDIVVVTHVSPIKAAVAWALDVGDEVVWRMFVAPASITRIAVSGRGASLHSFNETAHLR
jgi:broad specificity phosphatase PhoE